jgi:DNA-binding NarL/FixJ family response regulator
VKIFIWYPEHVLVMIVGDDAALSCWLFICDSVGSDCSSIAPADSPPACQEALMPRRSAEADSTSREALQTRDVAADGTALRILIISDVRLYRDALALRLNQDDRLSIVGSTEHGGAVPEVERCEPDLVLLDVCDWHGLELAQKLMALRPALMVVAIAVPEIAGHAIAATLRGIAGFVPRNGSINDVLAVIDHLAVRCNAPVLHPVPLLVSPDLSTGDGKARLDVADLTPREGEILQRIELGLSNKEIARDLRIEVGTVKNHVHNILEKLQVRRRNQAAHRIRARSSV